jgi:hypothetical protein
MPRTSYALLGATRSHRIDSPSFDQRTRDRPNACSLCHLERSERWAAEQSARWFGASAAFELQRPAELFDADTPAAAVFALAGDAGVRAVVAAALGRPDGPDVDAALRRQLLEVLEADDYAAVRFIAGRSKATLPGLAGQRLSSELVARLRALRDERPVTIAE